ncbi:hypothetical protein [Halovivax gelatinilyticus]|uniref:hypothetical protein n=1 Tax=Halovivax gelatinilyticus TaxID=2961597 RepID=UPI0020CA6907|nr:hypothetical protein [Halovivax gelatinilyticus]
MRMNRRNVLVGLGGIVAGGGALLGTGAFSSVTAERDVEVHVADDDEAYLSIEVHSSREDDEEFVEENGVVSFNFGEDGGVGLNDEAETNFHNLVTITNNGNDDVGVSITAYDEYDTDVGDRFQAYVGDDPNDTAEPLETLEHDSEDNSVDIGFQFDTEAKDVEEIDYIEIVAE